MMECFDSGRYDYVSENRTYATKRFIEELESLAVHNPDLGDADRTKVAALESLITNELRARRSNEGRAINKNRIDACFQDVVDRRERGVARKSAEDNLAAAS